MGINVPAYKVYTVRMIKNIQHHMNKIESEEQLVFNMDTTLSEIASFQTAVERLIKEILNLTQDEWAFSIEVTRELRNIHHCVIKYDRWYAQSENGDIDSDGIGFHPDTKYTDEDDTIYLWKDESFMEKIWG